jgi:uncharacterized repeat protein (TIGR01451 family)
VATQPETRGLEAFREFIGADDHAITDVKVGDTIRVRLRARNVNNRALHHVAMTDLLPGGFENAPNGLRPGLRTLPGATYVDAREDRNLVFLDLGPGESRTFEWAVRPTCAGTFVVPAPFGEAMYDRAICGTGAGGRITVRPR